MNPNPPWDTADPLGEALHFLRMSGTFYCRSEVTAPWGVDLPPMPDCLMFHVVTAGRCWLQVPGEPMRQLQPGDLVLVPHGHGHRLLSEPGAPAVGLFDLPREIASERYEVLRHGGGGDAVQMICGAVRFEHPAARHLVQMLPAVIAVDASRPPQAEWMYSTLRFMATEAQQMRPGGEAVMTRLADILVIQAIRAWLEQGSATHTGWLRALQDRQLGRVIVRIHRDPAHPWTLASLAAEAAMSRSAFAARFTQLVGEPAMQYVTRWRMHLAESWLKESATGVAETGARLGYQSEAAFSRAFKRYTGRPPGAVRRQPAVA
ncbi:AraC family transcriptional regulator [Schlegelella sp. S2-27]|uniref:AraC family transcriptional regulator n=1 Tax=Caldimonas mangrovi TaxID=2944811 RepID=A0ABT0YMZ8_9BURK|nr:AraC family transcriptional regulator [Caldimonas mangrovi]MCM5679744.1 AraC family transcriptional regulator [Caldimonas mangrovi]